MTQKLIFLSFSFFMAVQTHALQLNSIEELPQAMLDGRFFAAPGEESEDTIYEVQFVPDAAGPQQAVLCTSENLAECKPLSKSEEMAAQAGDPPGKPSKAVTLQPGITMGNQMTVFERIQYQPKSGLRLMKRVGLEVGVGWHLQYTSFKEGMVPESPEEQAMNNAIVGAPAGTEWYRKAGMYMRGNANVGLNVDVTNKLNVGATYFYYWNMKIIDDWFKEKFRPVGIHVQWNFWNDESGRSFIRFTNTRKLQEVYRSPKWWYLDMVQFGIIMNLGKKQN